MDLNNNYKNLPEQTRVWIYQSSRPFSLEETGMMDTQLSEFAQQWASHNRALKSFAKVFHNQFVVLMVDESQAGASGCSIDSSVHFIRSLQQQLGVDFFDRMTFAWSTPEGVKTAPRDEFAQLYQQGIISDETLVFDNLVTTKEQFEERWLRPLKESWHARMV